MELALLLPVLAVLLLGMIELGRYLDRAVVLEHAASDAAQAAAEAGEDEGESAAAAVVTLMLEGSGISEQADVTVTWTTEDELVLVIVEVSLDHTMLSDVLTLPGAVVRDAAWPVL